MKEYSIEWLILPLCYFIISFYNAKCKINLIHIDFNRIMKLLSFLAGANSTPTNPMPFVSVSPSTTTVSPDVIVPIDAILLAVCVFAIVACVLASINACCWCSDKPPRTPSSLPAPTRVLWISKSTHSQRSVQVQPTGRIRNHRKRSTPRLSKSRDRRPRPRARISRTTIKHQRQPLRRKLPKPRHRAKHRKPKSRSNETKLIGSEPDTLNQCEMIVAASISDHVEGLADQDTNHLIGRDDVIGGMTSALNSAIPAGDGPKPAEDTSVVGNIRESLFVTSKREDGTTAEK